MEFLNFIREEFGDLGMVICIGSPIYSIVVLIYDLCDWVFDIHDDHTIFQNLCEVMRDISTTPKGRLLAIVLFILCMLHMSAIMAGYFSLVITIGMSIV